MAENRFHLEHIVVSPKQKAIGSVIWLHGLGADGHDFSDIVPQLDLPPDLFLRFIFPHAPIRPITMNGNLPMRAWYDIYSLSDLAQEDESGLAQTQEAIYKLIERESVNSSQGIVLAGFSQGGAMALYAGLRSSTPLRGILALSTYLPLAQHLAVQAAPANRQTSIWMGHGEFDAVLPRDLGYRTYQLLKDQRYPVSWHEYPIAHQVCLAEIFDIRNWLIHLFANSIKPA